MQPKNMSDQAQGDLFRAHLEQILSHSHPLYVLANQIDWEFFDREFTRHFVENKGRPGLPTRLVVGLTYLKNAFNESDESVVERFLENPYWQYFCGFQYFQHKFPINPSSLTRWRQRIGPEGIEKLLTETINTAKRTGKMKTTHLNKLNVDTTVQEKAIAFPTDARLYYKMREALVRAARDKGIKLRQNYKRLGKKSLCMQGRYSHARQMKRARRETKKLKTYLGRVQRNIERECPAPEVSLSRLLDLATRLLKQKRQDKKKLYSIHAPEVECISKGKVHKKFEFGCKASIVSTSKGNWVVGADAFPGNPFDGHTLRRSLQQMIRLCDKIPKAVYCDGGYKGAAKSVPGVKVHMVNRRKKKLSRWERKWYKRRAAIEPIIGHLKADNRLHRNHLKGTAGDRMNVMLAACGFNLRKLYKAFFVQIIQRYFTTINAPEPYALVWI